MEIPEIAPEELSEGTTKESWPWVDAQATLFLIESPTKEGAMPAKSTRDKMTSV
jgi:hypothetical protein